MRYFLSTIINKELKAELRDMMRLFNKHKRHIYFEDIEKLHFNYKYLGNKISDDAIASISDDIKTFISQNKITQFVHPLSKIILGGKHELSPHTIKIMLKQTPELKAMFRILNEKVVIAAGDEVIRRKDHNSFLGVIKIGQIRNNVSVSDQNQIAEIIKNVNFAREIVVDNIAVIAAEPLATQAVKYTPIQVNYLSPPGELSAANLINE